LHACIRKERVLATTSRAVIISTKESTRNTTQVRVYVVVIRYNVSYRLPHGMEGVTFLLYKVPLTQS
jgi:hypothetical protein